MENNEKLKALLSKDYMPIIYKNIKVAELDVEDKL